VADTVRAAGVDTVQVDVMDGRFVPNITVGLPVVRALARHGGLKLDVHLMIVEPGRWVEAFVDAGAWVVTVHAEADVHVYRTVDLVRRSGCRAGVAINPGTPADRLTEVLDQIDLALVMTVNPGFGGQRFLPGMLPKIRRVREAVAARGLAVDVQVDGGIAPGSARQAVDAGASQLVAGSAVFAAGMPVHEAIAALHRDVASDRS
jgi:ribulose-phosphate 3-epimerase